MCMPCCEMRQLGWVWICLCIGSSALVPVLSPPLILVVACIPVVPRGLHSNHQDRTTTTTDSSSRCSTHHHQALPPPSSTSFGCHHHQQAPLPPSGAHACLARASDAARCRTRAGRCRDGAVHAGNVWARAWEASHGMGEGARMGQTLGRDTEAFSGPHAGVCFVYVYMCAGHVHVHVYTTPWAWATECVVVAGYELGHTHASTAREGTWAPCSYSSVRWCGLYRHDGCLCDPQHPRTLPNKLIFPAALIRVNHES